MCVLSMEHDKLFAIVDELLLSPVTLLVRLIMHRDTHEESYRRVPPCVLIIPSLIPGYPTPVLGQANIVCGAIFQF